MDTSGGIVTRNGHGAITAVITSFGYAHSEPPPGIVIDIRKHLRDPHVSPELREMTGLDLAVISKVLGTTGADELINGLVAMAMVLLPGATRANRLVRIAIGCVGGRHRSDQRRERRRKGKRCDGSQCVLLDHQVTEITEMVGLPRCHLGYHVWPGEPWDHCIRCFIRYPE